MAEILRRKKNMNLPNQILSVLNHGNHTKNLLTEGMNDSINAAPNNSFNRSANSVAFMRKICRL